MGRLVRAQVTSGSGHPVHRLTLDREAGAWYGVNAVFGCLLGFCVTMVPVTAARPFAVFAGTTAGVWILVLVWAFYRVGTVAAYAVEGSSSLVLRHFWRDVEVDSADVLRVRLAKQRQRVPLLVIERRAGDVRTRLLSPEQLECWRPGTLITLTDTAAGR